MISARLLSLTLLGAVIVEARHLHGKHGKKLSDITGEVDPEAPPEQSITLQGQPLFHIINVTSQFTTSHMKTHHLPIMALAGEGVAPTTITINFNSADVTLGPVQATLEFKQGHFRRTHVYDVDSMGKRCTKKDDGSFVCKAGQATIGPIILPAAEEFPAHTHSHPLQSSIKLHTNFGDLVLAAFFELQVVVAPSVDDEEHDPFNDFESLEL